MSSRATALLLALACLAPRAAAQESKALFDAPVVEFGSLDRLEHLLELDGAPGHEALTWWWQNGNETWFDVRAWSFDRDDGFEPLWEFAVSNAGAPSGGGWVTLLPTNVDSDGRDDLIVVNNKNVRVYQGQGLLEPSQIQSWTLTRNIVEGFAADFDGDGDDDLLLIDETGGASLYENTGAASNWDYVYTQSPTALGAATSRFRLGELTGDSSPDLFYTRDDAIVIQPIDASIAFTAAITWPLAAPFYTPNAAIGDIDGDGDVDAVIFAREQTFYTGRYTVLRRQDAGSAVFTKEDEAKGGPATDLIDVDGDGDLDGLCCGGGGGPSSSHYWHNRYSSTFEVCHNDGGGAFSLSFRLRGLGAKRLAAALDIDQDGDVDLLAGRAVYYPPAPITESFEGVLKWGESHARLLHDYEGDGDPDVRLTLDEVRRSDGTGSLESMAPVVASPLAGQEFKGPGYAGDFDGDGDVDLLVARWDAGAFASMCLLENNGGHFSDGGDAAAAGVSFSKTGDGDLDPRGAWSVDLDGDDDQDLVTWNPSSGSPQTTFWMNDGSGFFVQGAAGLSQSYIHAVDDFNADQLLDYVVSLDISSSSTSTSFYLYLGDGAGGTTGSHAIMDYHMYVKGSLGSVATGDFDDDGDLDLVACSQAYYYSAHTYLLTNDGAGNFSSTLLAPAGPFYSATAARVVSVDANQDGWSDVIVSPLDDGTTAGAILLRNPDGVGFQPVLEQVFQPLEAADVDGDGDPDLLDGSWWIYLDQDDRLIESRIHEGLDAGMRKQVGSGRAGPGAPTPTLGASGPFRVGESATLHLTGAAPGVSARLLAYQSAGAPEAAAPANGQPGAARHEILVKVIAFTTSGSPGDPAGSGKWTLPFQVPSYVGNSTVRYVVEVDDPQAPAGLATSNQLYIRYGE